MNRKLSMLKSFFTSPKTRLRVIGLLEGISYLVLLFIGVPLKRFGGNPDVVEVVGPIHGLLFVLYVLTVIQAKTEFRWPIGRTLLALAASVIPGGTFWADQAIFRKL